MRSNKQKNEFQKAQHYLRMTNLRVNDVYAQFVTLGTGVQVSLNHCGTAADKELIERDWCGIETRLMELQQTLQEVFERLEEDYRKSSVDE